MKFLSLPLLALLALAASPASAHTGIDATFGVVAGLAHPIGGLDHVLAMVAVGLLAAQLGGASLWRVPAVFVVVMAAGGALGFSGLALPYVEMGILGSVIVLGAVIALGGRMSPNLALALVGTFAVFHGHAHGSEMPTDAQGALYGLGFLTATAALHLSGIGLGLGLARSTPLALRTSGAAIACLGIGLAVL